MKVNGQRTYRSIAAMALALPMVAGAAATADAAKDLRLTVISGNNHNYAPVGAAVDNDWNDKRKSKYFNQIDLSDAAPDSANLYLKSLIRAQIDAYTSSKDNNPYYFRSRTPDLVDFDLARSRLQDACNEFKPFVGAIEMPTLEDKFSQGFTRLTTPRILALGAQ